MRTELFSHRVLLKSARERGKVKLTTFGVKGSSPSTLGHATSAGLSEDLVLDSSFYRPVKLTVESFSKHCPTIPDATAVEAK